MSTRGAYGFKINGEYKVAFNGSDSYPECLGEHVIKFVAKTPLAEIRKIAKKITLLNEHSVPTEEQIKQCNFSKPISEINENWDNLLEETYGNIFALKDIPFMFDAQDFMGDGLFCEWLYIINLDNKTLDVYRHGNSDLIKSFPLKSLGGINIVKITKLLKEIRKEVYVE